MSNRRILYKQPSIVGSQAWSEHGDDSPKIEGHSPKTANHCLIIPFRFVGAMIQHAGETHPKECCGIIAGTDQLPNISIGRALFKMDNVATGNDEFHVDPDAQLILSQEMDQQGQKLLGIYHSHPTTPPAPSISDINLCFYPEVVHFIIGQDAVTMWTIDPERAARVAAVGVSGELMKIWTTRP